ncbi:hypothetical protein OLMES_0487 [Oleiphilus messinensis]|uniref:Uncharacterized protein n=1 Tax=Oleiphilus messinensis TaxID=141451 RepID=A0A1Y0I2V0_9GAMM|nr:hypothetical protein [Oleiphilus messinensis]ARU54590.1 hypothetical protein OLMES_0487 [Oleiphilus messinensis]
MQHEHIHLVGDVLLGWIGLGVLIVFWLPARKYNVKASKTRDHIMQI